MDNVTATLLEIAKYTIPGIIVMIATANIVKRFIAAETRRKQMELFSSSQDVTLRLRLQAYERLALFLERISSRNLVPRVYDPAMSVSDLHAAMVMSIRGEFEHNLSQQIYVSKNIWETVKGVKEQELNMINRVAASLNPDAHAKELHLRILELVAKAEGAMPTDVALEMLQNEAKTVMQFGA